MKLLVRLGGLEPPTPTLSARYPAGTVLFSPYSYAGERHGSAWFSRCRFEPTGASWGARAGVWIAGAERDPFRHLAPSTGVWGLAPTLPNVLELRSVAGSVPTGSHPYLPLVISQRTRSRRWGKGDTELVECVESQVEDEEDDAGNEPHHASAVHGLDLVPEVPDEPGDEDEAGDGGDGEGDWEEAGDLVDGGCHGRQGIGMRACRG